MWTVFLPKWGIYYSKVYSEPTINESLHVGLSEALTVVLYKFMYNNRGPK